MAGHPAADKAGSAGREPARVFDPVLLSSPTPITCLHPNAIFLCSLWVKSPQGILSEELASAARMFCKAMRTWRYAFKLAPLKETTGSCFKTQHPRDVAIKTYQNYFLRWFLIN